MVFLAIRSPSLYDMRHSGFARLCNNNNNDLEYKTKLTDRFGSTTFEGKHCTRYLQHLLDSSPDHPLFVTTLSVQDLS